MWARLPIACWPLAWLSLWWAGAATATAYRLPMMRAPRALPRLRTPLLSLHAQTLKLNPHAGLKNPYEMRALRLIPAPPDSEAS